MKNRITLALIALAACTTLAQTAPEDPARPTLGQTGKIFTVKYTPGARKIEIGLVGKPAVVMDPNKITVMGRVFSSNSKSTDLKVKPAGGHWEILNPIEESDTLELKVEDKTNKKTETLKIAPPR
ncbi:MAG: hypothetical protein AB7F86_03925 [Bdellovibrionales bacterium]